MDGTAQAYEGDAALARRLARAGTALDVTAVRDLVAGIAAAPPSRDDASWIALVAPQADPILAAQLRALRDAMVAELPRLEPRPPVERLETLRAALEAQGLDGFLVPRSDEHQNEFVPPCAERLRWLTGFSGSAGLAVVLRDKAALFVDGRYTLQARDEVEPGAFEIRHLLDEPPSEWIVDHIRPGARIGYDPWLHTEAAIRRLARRLEAAGGSLVDLAANPIDKLWSDRPPKPLAPIVAHPPDYSGRSSAEKRREIAAVFGQEGVEAAVLTAPESIAWLLNVRGGDVPFTPLPLSFAILYRSGVVRWFVDRRKLAPGLAEELGQGVRIEAVERFIEGLDELGRAGARVRVDPDTVAAFVFKRLREAGAEVAAGRDPCLLPKACKNATELAGARAAHRRDGVALTRFLAWFAREAPKGELTERAAARRLDELRAEQALFRGPSFATISASGPNGAIVHYIATAESDRRIRAGDLYLVDSGGQYLDGTTDVTRTVAVGPPGPEVKDRFTRVLKGHIALATIRFPEGTTGAQLDALARQALWRAGLDFDHGTGHGVGSYLGVHEGPQRISKSASDVALRPGMILSNEPGYYEADAYGIRIENLVTVVSCADGRAESASFLAFETLTRAPIDRALIEPDLLTREELDWIDAYHAQVYQDLAPLLDDESRAWLRTATLPIGT